MIKYDITTDEHLDVFKDKIITKPTFSSLPPESLSLKDLVLVYYNGIKWNIIPLNIMLNYPVVHDVIYDQYTITNTGVDIADVENKADGHTIDVTIAYCPYTGSALIIEGFYTLSDKIVNSCLSLEKESEPNKLIPILTGLDITKDENKDELHPIRKFEVEIKTFRSAMTNNPNCQYLDLQKNNIDLSLKPVVPMSYLKTTDIIDKTNDTNKSQMEKFHPKTLVHVVQYKSPRTNKLKHTIIVGVDANKSTYSGYDVRKSGLSKYIHEMDDELRSRLGFITPVYWHAWNKFYPDSKIILIK
jgi:hypothetical protein